MNDHHRSRGGANPDLVSGHLRKRLKQLRAERAWSLDALARYALKLGPPNRPARRFIGE